MFGEIGHVKKAITVYRRHDKGIWNRMNDDDKNKRTIELIDDYNKFLNYTYDEQFSKIRKFCESNLGNRYLETLVYRH